MLSEASGIFLAAVPAYFFGQGLDNRSGAAQGIPLQICQLSSITSVFFAAIHSSKQLNYFPSFSFFFSSLVGLISLGILKIPLYYWINVSVHPSVCPHLVGGGGGVPQPSPDRGYSSQSDLVTGYPCWGVPHLRYPPSDLAGGYPCLGGGGTPRQVPPPIRPGQGVPHLRDAPPAIRSGQGGTPAGGRYPTSGTVPSDLAGGTPAGGGYPTSDNRWST